MWYIRKSSVKNICFHHHNMTSLPVSASQFQLRGDWEIAHRIRAFVKLCQILIQDINIYSRCDIKFSQSASSNLNWNGRFFCRPKLLKSRLVSWSVAAQFSITWQWRTQVLLIPDTNLTLLCTISTPMSVWEENFGRKTKGKGAGSRSAWRFDLLWIIVCWIVCSPTSKKCHQPPLILVLGRMTKNLYHLIFQNFTGFTVCDGIYFFHAWPDVNQIFYWLRVNTAIDWLTMSYFTVMSEYCRKIILCIILY